MDCVGGSKFAKLYKGANRIQEDERQEIRRKLLLEEQKRTRAESHDNVRNIQEFVEKIKRKKQARQLHRRKLADDNPVQLSEWMKDRPEDLEQWLLVPCPKGRRCLLIASKGRTEIYNQYGYFMQSLHTVLPGDSQAKHQVTILDCILDSNSKKIFVLDMIAYGGQDLVSCDAEFRFYWVATRIPECQRETGSEYELIPLRCYKMADEGLVTSCFERFPQFDDNNPELDGFLFYHKDASYTYGTTPLVLWLFAFMVPEVLGYDVHPTYVMSRPSDYVNCAHYMTEFDEALLKRKVKIKEKQSRSRNRRKMDEDSFEGCDDEPDLMDGVLDCDGNDESIELNAIIDHARALETESNIV